MIGLILAATVASAPYVAPDGRTEAQLIAAHVLPDLTKTPGVFNTALAPDLAHITPNIMRATICKAGWTATVRPSTGWTDKLRAQDVIPGHNPAEYELDHLQSIEDLGAPADPLNLWDMAYGDRYGARVKDVLETKVKHLLCTGEITPQQAHDALVPNWLVGYVKYVGPLP